MNLSELITAGEPVTNTYTKVLDLFKDKSRFTQRTYQRDEKGNECGWREGYSFCVLGALCFFTSGLTYRAQCCLQRVSEHLYGKTIQEVNDGANGYERVIKALEFTRDLWKDHEPTLDDLSLSVSDLLKKRKASQ